MRPGFSLLLSVVLLAQAAAPPKLPEPYQALADQAHAAPPELAADALFRIVESGKLSDRTARRDLIEQAFGLAATAKLPVRMQGLPGTVTDTRSGSLSQAYELKLDTLSLQSRAAQDMLPLDPSKARELFQEITRPELAPLTCEDALVYEVSDFYRALGAIANGAFTKQERDKEAHLNFLLDYLGQVTSPAQLAPLARVIESASVTNEQRDVLWTRFSGLLEGMDPDERSFAASLAALAGVSVPQIKASLEKYRQRHHGCESDSPPSRNSAGGARPDAADRPETPKLERYWQSATAQQLLEAGQKLRFGPGQRLLSEADRSSPQWQTQLADYLGQLASWTSDQEKSEADYYHQKCIVYEALVELIPPGQQREKVLEDYVSFVSSSNLYQQNPAEWFVGPNTLLERMQGASDELPKVLEAYRASGNPVLALAAALRTTLGRQRPAWAVSQR